jgi:YD repeat-containing protein
MTERSVTRLLCLAAVLALCGRAGASSKCDIKNLGSTTAADVQALINEALGSSAPNNDLNGDGVINVVDVMIDAGVVLGDPCYADPGLVSIVPNSGQQGASGIVVTITGRLSSFTNSSAVSLGAGITVTNVASTSATVLTATLAIDPAATTGARTLTVDGLTLANAFTVTQPVSVSYTYDSQGRLATTAYIQASGATITVTYTYDAAGNRTVVVAQ